MFTAVWSGQEDKVLLSSLTTEMESASEVTFLTQLSRDTKKTPCVLSFQEGPPGNNTATKKCILRSVEGQSVST